MPFDKHNAASLVIDYSFERAGTEKINRDTDCGHLEQPLTERDLVSTPPMFNAAF